MFYHKMRTAATLRTAVGLGLGRELWLVQVGILVNALGWGAVLPFEVIYLHDARGFGLGTAGLVVGTVTGVAVVAAPLAGWWIDRLGARSCASAGGIALAAGYAGLAVARTPGVAFAAAVVAGAGNGLLLPSQSALLATLAPAALRHRAAAISRVATNAGFGLGGALGGLVAAEGLHGLVALFLANAASYVLFVLVLRAVVPADASLERPAGGYRDVLRDRAFVRLALANAVVIAVGWGALPWLVPPFAAHDLGLGPRSIGTLLLANAATVVVAQLPVARLAEGRRRVVPMALGAATIAAACVAIAGAARVPSAGYPILAAAAVAIGIGECLYTAALLPLVADLAPAAIRGRYMAAVGLSWWAGLALAPALGAELLSVSPPLAFAVFAAAAVVAAAALLALDGRLPPAARRTPRT